MKLTTDFLPLLCCCLSVVKLFHLLDSDWSRRVGVAVLILCMIPTGLDDDSEMNRNTRVVSKTQLGIASQKLIRTPIQNRAWSTIEIKLTVDKVE
jgi:hypothetical protein